MCKGKNKRRWRAYREKGLHKQNGQWNLKSA